MPHRKNDPSKPKRIILAGGGHSHLAVLEDWRREPLPGTERILITPYPRMTYSGMLPGWIEGLYRRSELEINLGPLAAAAGARIVQDEVVALDADAKRLTLASGSVLDYDVLSLAVGGNLDLTAFPDLATVLPVRPIDRFLDRWSKFAQSWSGNERPRIAVIGGGAAGTELALAIAAHFRRLSRRAEIVLIAGYDSQLAGHAEGVWARARTALRDSGVEIHAVNAEFDGDKLLVPGGTAASFDTILAATGSNPPDWLADSGLLLGPGGGVAIDPSMRSLSHPQVFAAGDVSERTDRQLARSGVHAVKAGPVLAANLRAALRGDKTHNYRPRSRTLYLLSTGGRKAILSWGSFSAQGAWVWRLKDFIDRRFVMHFQRLSVKG